ncbi:hypothetical protein F0U60_23755 [Archangium minus]|uniref:Uncharacterized protein n=1 Tax=Archangium minus TaxID=83450 RepID=A0ABY9WUA2_9BACT|nr:hypothetical protein F0U60_23755 [Archangium minus]
MTAQISDSVQYTNRTFSLRGVKGSGLFEPRQHGLNPQMVSTACYRGYICTYDVSNGGLFLEELLLGLEPREELAARHGKGKPLFGRVPRYMGQPHGSVVYEQLHWPTLFSGGLLVATDFIQELSVHTGIHPAWRFKEVHELLFEEGRLVEAFDCSVAMTRVRERMHVSTLTPGRSLSRSEIEQRLEALFRLDYS